MSALARSPQRPPDYVPLDVFWRNRGFEKMEGLQCRISWKDHDEVSESPKTLQFWGKELSEL